MTNDKRKQAGFTIVELLVSVAIFSLVTAFGVTVFVRSLRAQRSVVSLISASDNASLAIEAIGREIRRGTNFGPNGFNKSDSPELYFINAEGKEIVYRFDSTEKSITRNEDFTGFFPVTAPNIVVEEAHFAIMDTDPVSGRPILPRVTISIKLQAKERDINDVVTQIHTTVSSRGLNNPPPPSP